MKEQLITFETAKLAKEMGFQSYTSFYYSEGMEIKGTKMGMHGNPNAYGGISAPTQSLLQKWLRKNHNLHIHIINKKDEMNEEDYFELYVEDKFLSDTHTYEEALEKGLVAALKYTFGNEI